MINQNISLRTFLLLLIVCVIIGVVFAVFIFAPRGASQDLLSNDEEQIYQFPNTPTPLPHKTKPLPPPPVSGLPENPEKFCAQIITPAINQETLEIKNFPTPCDVPAGWKILNTPPGN